MMGGAVPRPILINPLFIGLMSAVTQAKRGRSGGGYNSRPLCRWRLYFYRYPQCASRAPICNP